MTGIRRLGDLTPLEASVLTSVVGSPDFYRSRSLNEVLPNASGLVSAMISYALYGHPALEDKPEEFRQLIPRFVDSLRDDIQARQAVARKEREYRNLAYASGK